MGLTMGIKAEQKADNLKIFCTAQVDVRGTLAAKYFEILRFSCEYAALTPIAKPKTFHQWR